MAFVSSYGEVERGKRGATRARRRRVLSCLVEVETSERDVAYEDQTRRDVAHAW